MIIKIAIGLFIFLELLNVISLYFSPENPYANTMGVFKQWHITKHDDDTHLLFRYMVAWVAGTKLIFILLLVTILIFGSDQILFYTVIALLLGILTYYWKMRSMIIEMDQRDLLDPTGYSNTLTKMITFLIIMLAGAGIIQFILDPLML